MAIALVLMALGVYRKTVMEDYMLSKAFLEPMVQRMTIRVRLLSLFRADISQLKTMLNTRIDYLNTTFDTIEKKFGSTESFLDSLGMDGDRRKSLRNILCG